ncbi:MAG: DNA polymerase III subunit chi [Beijerinckiaceae bacterium]
MEVFFYHLQGQSLEQTLPQLLERTLQRGWKAVVRASSAERLKALDDHLWTYADESFLPHGVENDVQAGAFPVVLTLGGERLNGADVCFAVDGAQLPETEGWARSVLIFDGGDPEALDAARQQWKQVKAKGLAATYWQQTPEGRWEQKA